ncbi:hypothetical protein TRFO_22922 [Tritrichomonas foetus]|uniref:Tricarboxylate carrier n=1 Tax=Tritrichomonas foetus TaxID=1144522 RepID=A0A1J4KFG4_9EUKA|nr:hypothetical protein TRFO_22922 [Tritrichomonas foetus]|eukprot:OHT08508.1 hypothetical protein TRFO_22922 [Tritrichomonas foetus]
MSQKKEKKEEHENLRKRDLEYALKKSADTFMNGMLYSMVHKTIANFMSPDRKDFNAKVFLLESIGSGTEFAAFDFTNGVLDAIIQPNLDTFSKWVPWTISTAALSSIVSRAVQTPVKNYSENGEFSFKDFSKDLKEATPQLVGFNTMKEYADMALPPKEKLGGKYMRTTLCLAAGNAGSMAASLPAMYPKYPVKVLLLGFLPTIPLCFVENAIFTSVKSFTKPFRLLPK